MSEQAYFWTLSALLQGFAALMALSGMFALHRLRTHRQESLTTMKRVRESGGLHEGIRKGLELQEQKEIAYINYLQDQIKHLTEERCARGADHPNRQREIQDQIDRIEDFIRQLHTREETRHMLIMWTLWSTAFCGAVVFFSKCFLPLGDSPVTVFRTAIVVLSSLMAAAALMITGTVIILMLLTADATNGAFLRRFLVRRLRSLLGPHIAEPTGGGSS